MKFNSRIDSGSNYSIVYGGRSFYIAERLGFLILIMEYTVFSGIFITILNGHFDRPGLPKKILRKFEYLSNYGRKPPTSLKGETTKGTVDQQFYCKNYTVLIFLPFI